MDWKSEEGRALLRRAYPNGHLPRPGINTLGEWTCLRGSGEGGRAVGSFVRMDVAYSLAGADLEAIDRRRCVAEIDVGGSHIVNHAAISLEDARKVRSSGDLLPFPDIADRASWACLCDELARAYARGHAWEIQDVVQAMVTCQSMNSPTAWYLTFLRGNLAQVSNHFLSFPAGMHPGEDIARALVLARIYLREAEIKKGTPT